MTTSKEHSVSVADIFCRRADHCLYDHDAKELPLQATQLLWINMVSAIDPVCVYL